MSEYQLDQDPQLEPLLQATEQLMLECAGQPGAPRLDELIRYHLASGGARVRAKLALHAAIALQLPPSVGVALAAACELIHNGSLLHDDIQDRDTERRGQEAAWSRFDVNTAMCAGTLLLSAAYTALLQGQSSTAELIAHTHRRTADLIAGQTLDLQVPIKAPSQEQYLQIAAAKSGSLLALPLELAMISANQHDHVHQARLAGESFAIAYQIIDDLSDVDMDLSKGHNNIIGVLELEGVTRHEAIETATHLAQAQLKSAMQQAASLPGDSAHYLITLCQQLAHSVCQPETQMAWQRG
jgi:geranylgeranyl diphosphate synthase type I